MFKRIIGLALGLAVSCLAFAAPQLATAAPAIVADAVSRIAAPPLPLASALPVDQMVFVLTAEHDPAPPLALIDPGEGDGGGQGDETVASLGDPGDGTDTGDGTQSAHGLDPGDGTEPEPEAA